MESIIVEKMDHKIGCVLCAKLSERLKTIKKENTELHADLLYLRSMCNRMGYDTLSRL